MKKKHIILILTALTALSCGRVVVDDGPDEPIGFGWYAARSAKASTKADTGTLVTGVTHLPSGSTFGVFGYFHAQSGTAQNPVAGGWKDNVSRNYPNLFYNESVAISGSNGNYTYSYDNSRYWPKNTNDRISFFAYFPYNASMVEDEQEQQSNTAIVEPILDYNNAQEGMVSFYYTVPADPADHVDFMVSDLCADQSKALWNTDHTRGLTGTENGKVKFFFHHALCQIRIRPVEFEATNPNVEVNLKSVRFTGIPMSGRCVPTPNFTLKDANTGRTPVTPTWPTQYFSVLRPGELSETGVTTAACYNTQGVLTAPENILLLMPQTFQEDGDAYIEVRVDLVRWKNINDKGYLQDGVTPDPAKYNYYYPDTILNVPLYSGVTSWQAGKIYTYSLAVNVQTIRVTGVEVDTWQTATEDVFMDPIPNE